MEESPLTAIDNANVTRYRQIVQNQAGKAFFPDGRAQQIMHALSSSADESFLVTPTLNLVEKLTCLEQLFDDTMTIKQLAENIKALKLVYAALLKAASQKELIAVFEQVKCSKLVPHCRKTHTTTTTTAQDITLIYYNHTLPLPYPEANQKLPKLQTMKM